MFFLSSLFLGGTMVSVFVWVTHHIFYESVSNFLEKMMSR